MEIDFLKSFLVIAELESITLASDVLNISPSALSSGLQKLEGELGYRLFERSPKGLRLTDRGTFFRTWAEKNAGFQAELGRALRSSAAEQGVLRIGTAVQCDTLFILLSAFQKRCPNIRIELYGENSLLENYLLTDLDGFVVPSKDSRNLPGILIAHRNSLFVLMREQHPLAARESLTLDDLSEQPFVFSSHNGQLEWVFDYCTQHGLHPRVQYLCEEYDGKLDILASSDTVTIGYNTMRLLRENMRGIKAVPLETEDQMREAFHFVWRTEPLNPLAGLLTDFASEFHDRGREAFMANP